MEIAQTVATQPRQLHYSNNLSKKKQNLYLLKFISLRATLCTEPVLGQGDCRNYKKKKNVAILLVHNTYIIKVMYSQYVSRHR